MSVFFVIQKPESIYDDQEGNCYDYKTSLPNGKQIQEGDWLILSLTNKTSKFGKKIIGIGQIETIDYRRVGQNTFATANYSRFKQFKPPLTYETIGGDPRINKQHAMNRVNEEVGERVLAFLVNYNPESSEKITLNKLDNQKTKGSRLILCECKSCGCKIRLARTWIDLAFESFESGLICPVCREINMETN